MTARKALVELLKAEAECRSFFRSLCAESSLALRSQAWQFRLELNDRGHEFEHEDLEDVLFELAPSCSLTAGLLSGIPSGLLSWPPERYATLPSAV